MMKTQQFILTVILILALSQCLVSAQSSDPGLPSEAQQAMDKGIAAAKEQKWEEAIRYFSEARDIAPTSGHTLFNLALASDKITGRELIAIAWYKAYLAAAPDAANSSMVRTRIAELEALALEKIKKLNETAEKAIALHPNYMERREYFKLFAVAQALSNDIEGAMEIASGKSIGGYKNHVFTTVAKMQVLAGDIDAANKTAESI